MKKNWTKYAAIAWEVLIQLANSDGGTIQYKQLEKEVGLDEGQQSYNFTGRNARRILTPILKHCHERGLPLLSVLAHNWKGQRGEGYRGYQGRSLAAEITAVRDFQWMTEPNPFISQEDMHTVIAEMLTAEPEELEAWTKKYPARGYQQKVFREALRKVYGDQCALCSYNHPALLEAAHLKPWAVASASERIDVRNGLLLCRNHHAMLDAGLLRIYEADSIPHWRVATVQRGERQYALPRVSTDALRWSEQEKHWPLGEWLAWRR